jgi:hypothetical protein
MWSFGRPKRNFLLMTTANVIYAMQVQKQGPLHVRGGPPVPPRQPSPFSSCPGTVRLYDRKRWIDGTWGDYFYVPERGIPRSRTSQASRRRCC